MKLLDKFLYRFTNKQKIDELKKEAKKIIENKNRDLFQPSLKDDYISLGSWNTYTYYENHEKKKGETVNLDCKMFDVEGDEIDTLKELCGIIEDTIAYSMSSISPQINANVEIVKRKHKMSALIESIREQLK